MSDHKTEVTQEDIKHLCLKVGEEKFLNRARQFAEWLNRFIDSSVKRKAYPASARLLNNMTAEEMGVYLNYLYWNTIEEFVRPNLKNPKGQPQNAEVIKPIINHYKIAATVEYVVMRYLPFEDGSQQPLIDLNADFAFHVSSQILFCWNIHKEDIKPVVIKELITGDHNTKAFIQEHKAWLRHHAIASPFVIFSNMQTMRLFHYWFRDPKAEFQSF